MATHRIVNVRYSEPRSYRHCEKCNKSLETGAPFDVLAWGNDSHFTNRTWFCHEHGKQLRDVIRAWAKS